MKTIERDSAQKFSLMLWVFTLVSLGLQFFSFLFFYTFIFLLFVFADTLCLKRSAVPRCQYFSHFVRRILVFAIGFYVASGGSPRTPNCLLSIKITEFFDFHLFDLILLTTSQPNNATILTTLCFFTEQFPFNQNLALS